MKITEEAVGVILSVMNKIGLDPKVYFLYFSSPKERRDGFGFTFTRSDEIGKRYDFGELRTIVDLGMDVGELIIDVQEINGSKGLVFKGDNNDYDHREGR